MLLKQILKSKKNEIKQRKKQFPLKELKEKLKKPKPSQDFLGALSRDVTSSKKQSPRISSLISIIAEIKKASPFKGIIRKNFDPLFLARQCIKGGADALSVLTDERFFEGNIKHLKEIKKKYDIPLLRKDFIIDEYQIYEAKYFGADAILLIAEILTLDELKKFIKITQQLKLFYIIEVHQEKNLKKILALSPQIIGINNRDLKTGKTNLKITAELMRIIKKYYPQKKLRPVIVSESGIKTKEDVEDLKNLGVDAVLIGEEIMRSKNIARKISLLKGS